MMGSRACGSWEPALGTEEESTCHDFSKLEDVLKDMECVSQLDLVPLELAYWVPFFLYVQHQGMFSLKLRLCVFWNSSLEPAQPWQDLVPSALILAPT